MSKNGGEDDGRGRDGGRPDTEGEDFDAVGAAEELAASMGEGSARAMSGGSEPYIDMLEGEVAALQQELAEANARARRAENRAADAAGEIGRSSDRIAREAEREREQQLRKTLSRFLDVLDDLDRAIGAAREMDHNPDVLAGVELVRKRFLSLLADFGVRRLSTNGERFDPAIHDAVSAVPVADRRQDGQVVGVVSEGYAIGDEVLRPARVAVGKAS